MSHKHDPGIAYQRGVQVRPVAESLKRWHRYPLDPRDQGRFAGIGMAEDATLNRVANAGKRRQRANLRNQRNALSAVTRIRAAEAVAHRLQTHLAFGHAGYIAGYWAMAGELPLHVLQLRLRCDQVWCLPVLQPDQTLRFAPWRPGDPLVCNRFGIPEPELASSSLLEAQAMHVVLVPLLGFTRQGDRLGMGGGYYDRSFSFRRQRPAPPALIGVGYAFQQIDGFAAEAWDVRMDAIVTERELMVCGQK